MKILLTAVNAKYIHSNLAVYSLRAYAREYEELIGLAEYTINQKKDEIIKGIFRHQPEVLCISCYIWNISMVKEIIAELHKILPDTVIWLGGPEVSYDAGQVLEELPQVKGIMKGEGEAVFLELAEHYVKGTPSLSQIAGITYREETGEGTVGGIRDNGWRDVMDLSEIPFVYEHLEDFENRIIYYESSRGCPFSCSYCLSSVDKKLRFRDSELVKRELQFFLDHKAPQVKFVDRTFNCSPRHAMAVWEYLTEHDNGITNFHFEIAADLLREEEIALIRRMRPGMIQLEIGVQSTNPRTLEAIGRKMDFKKVARAAAEVGAGHNVHQHLDLIAGLPYEDYPSFRRSFGDVYRLRPQQLQLGFLKVLKGSGMQRMAEQYGCKYQSTEPYEVLFTRWLSYPDILRLKLVEEMVEVYYNSGQFARLLPAAEALFEEAFDFYEALGLFYEERGYLDISHNRVRRYEILLEFLYERDPARLQLYRELAVFDLYTRENLKNRPAWAGDLNGCKERFRRFYRREEKERRYLPDYSGYDGRQLANMTHMEVLHFHPDTWEPGEYCYLFDYRRRDPLTHGAGFQEVRFDEEDERDTGSAG